MKRIIFLIVCACFALVSNVSAAKVDLEARNVYFVDNGNNGGYTENGLYVNVQNNGPDDFSGSFVITTLTTMNTFTTNYSGQIDAGSYVKIKLLASAKDAYCVWIDSGVEIIETNKNNNHYYFQIEKPQVRILSSWNQIAAKNYRDTLFVLPGEYFYEQFVLSELAHQNSIIGFDFISYASGFSEAQDYYFGVQSLWPDSVYKDGNLIGGKYSFESGSFQNSNTAKCKWMANSSAAAINYFWLGAYQGVARQMEVGSVANINMSVVVATNDLERRYDNVFKKIKVIDRIRGDVNDDGIVDNKDLEILNYVLDYGQYNPAISYRNMYLQRGLNYGAGIVIFSQPDFLSNCLINIWLNDRNDPLVQGLGIGELMSKRDQSSPISGVKNNFSVNGEELKIYSPDADLYNVTAQVDGKLFQKTGKISEKVLLPFGASKIRVETVKVKRDLTAMNEKIDMLSVSVYPNPVVDYLVINGVEKATVKVINLSGQTVYSANFNNETRINSKDWTNGVYIVNIYSASGAKKSVKIIK